MARTRRMPFKPPQDDAPEQSINVLPIGTHLGEFEIQKLIGEGGFGVVYLAYDHSLERQVALKEYMPSGLATRTSAMGVTVRSQRNLDTFTLGLKSFINEARMLAQFDSPALVKVHLFWEGNGTAYMVMPFYEGVTLKQALKERRVTPSEPWIRLLLADLFDAIEIIHSVQCLHRDIAPDNILLLKDGRPLLLDFGAARRVIGDLTQCLTAILKPGFAPIEQYADMPGLRQGAWTDIYALAAVVYYLITGKAPPPAVARMVHDEMVPASEAGKGKYSSSFLAALDKALAVKPEQRFKSIADMRHALNITETVPRTLPRPASDWSPTVAQTIPLADAMPNARPDIQADMQAGMYAGSRHEKTRRVEPRLEPELESRRGTRTEAKPATKTADGTDFPPPGNRQKPQQAHSMEGKPKKHKLEWLVIGLMLIAAIASGIFLGSNRLWNERPDAMFASSGGDAASSASGAGEAPDAGTANRANVQNQPSGTNQATAKVAPEPPSSVAPASPADASSSVASIAPRADEAANPQAEKSDKADKVAKSDDGEHAATASRSPSEIELWRNASTANKAGAYQDYLDQYPKGRYAAIARLRLERLQPKLAKLAPSTEMQAPQAQNTKPKPAPRTTRKETMPSVEEDAWIRASTIDQAPAYAEYLSQYPNGRYAALARDKLTGSKPQPEVFLAPPASAKSQPPKEAEKTQVPPIAMQERSVPVDADRHAVTKPSETAVPPVKKPPDVASTPVRAVPGTASDSQTIRVGDQTMIGNFSIDPATGQVSGNGKIIWNNGNQFIGTLVHGIKEGKGKFIWSNGQQYNGDWARDKPNGKGTISFADGSRYRGELKDGIQQGQGSTRFKNGDVYNGEWVQGKSNGHGRYTWADGSYWEGEFQDGKRTGNGQMVSTAGTLSAGTDASSGAATAGRNVEPQTHNREPEEN